MHVDIRLPEIMLRESQESTKQSCTLEFLEILEKLQPPKGSFDIQKLYRFYRLHPKRPYIF